MARRLVFRLINLILIRVWIKRDVNDRSLPSPKLKTIIVILTDNRLNTDKRQIHDVYYRFRSTF